MFRSVGRVDSCARDEGLGTLDRKDIVVFLVRWYILYIQQQARSERTRAYPRAYPSAYRRDDVRGFEVALNKRGRFRARGIAGLTGPGRVPARSLVSTEGKEVG